MSRFQVQLFVLALMASACNCGEQPPPPEPNWVVQQPFAQPPDSLASTGLSSCAVLDVERCEGGKLQRCSLMDKATGAPAGSPDPLLQRVLSFERWYELHHSPDGITMERDFTESIPAGTSEATWSSLEKFAGYGGSFDGAIWTGVALNAYLMRYLVTGTQADYQRMEDKVRAALTLFEVTGVPGYLARNHFLDLPAGAPKSDEHYLQYDAGTADPPTLKIRAIENPGSVSGLPTDYLNGISDGDGGTWTGVPMWTGYPSIDQYSGMTVSLPAVYGLLKDETLKSRIAHHLTCYLKRLHRLEIRSVQKSPDVLNAMKSLLGGSSEIDLSAIDKMVVYYLPQLNSKTAATFDKSCPDTITRTPDRVLDARSGSFEGDLLQLIGDLSPNGESSRGIDHYYIPNVRGADAVHLMNLTAAAYYFTGDELYRSFMDEELIGALKADTVAATISVGKPNKWCRKFYDSHISIPVVWGLANVLGPSPLRTQVESVLWNSAWLQDGLNLGSAKFGVMAASRAPEGTDVAQAVSLSLREIDHMGGNGGVLLDPRRTYTLNFEQVVDAGMASECPTEAQRTACEEGPTLFGIKLQGQKITRACTGAPGECVMDGGVCATAMASSALPVEHRAWGDFIWQRNPFQMAVSYSPEATTQSPGLDLTEEYWLARYFGYTKAGEGQALAWHDVGTCN